MAKPMPKQLKMTSVRKAPERGTTTDGRPGAGSSELSPLLLSSGFADTRASYHGAGAGAGVEGITTFAGGR